MLKKFSYDVVVYNKMIYILRGVLDAVVRIISGDHTTKTLSVYYLALVHTKCKNKVVDICFDFVKC